MVRTVRAPEEYGELFERAEELVSEYFGRKREVPDKGRIEIDGQRYVLVRAPSLSVEFYDLMERLYGGRKEQAHAVGRNLLFHLAHFIGRSDARAFHERLQLDNPLAKLSAGPVHFAHAGWAYVDILPESSPLPSEEYFLIYDHPYSFESDSWRRAGREAPCPICFMNAGYSAGWCEESFGLRLAATEILCVAKGDPWCRFVMAPPHRLQARISSYLEEHPDVAEAVTSYELPGEFEHRELAQRLRLSESRYRQLFDASTDAILTVDAGTIDHVNRRAAEILGTSRGELRGRTLLSLCSPEEADRQCAADLDEACRRALDEGPQELSVPLVGARGQRIVAEVSISRIEGTKESLLAVIRDVTERERLADELRRAQRMEAVGNLAGGIAHDFNNILTGASGNLAQLRKELDGGSGRGGRWLAETRLAIDRAEALVRQLLTLTRTSQRPWEPVDLVGLVDEVARRSGEGLDPRISIVTDHGLVSLVEGVEDDLEQALLNLTTNAVDAVSARLDAGAGGDGAAGRIAIETAIEVEPTKADGTRARGYYARVTVTDDGEGMDEATARRCFEPFFTTKQAGESKGMGMTTAFGVVQQHGGWIAIEPPPAGGGTRLSVMIPVAKQVRPPQRRETSYEPPAGGTETILFVDDEEPLRRLARFVFDGLGYTLLPAAGGAEALRIVEEEPVDIVVLDLTMPHMSGKDVLGRLREIRPDLPVVLSSGYSVDFRGDELREQGARTFVPKPYDMDDLARLIRDVLDER